MLTTDDLQKIRAIVKETVDDSLKVKLKPINERLDKEFPSIHQRLDRIETSLNNFQTEVAQEFYRVHEILGEIRTDLHVTQKKVDKHEKLLN